jgi:hypothetical protein
MTVGRCLLIVVNFLYDIDDGRELPKLTDDSELSINIKWLIQIIVLVGGAVLLYSKLENRITDLENETKSIRFNQNNYVFPDIRMLEDEILQYKLWRERTTKDIEEMQKK